MLFKVVEVILQHVGQKTSFKRTKFVLLHSLAFPHYLHGFLKMLLARTGFIIFSFMFRSNPLCITNTRKTHKKVNLLYLVHTVDHCSFLCFGQVMITTGLFLMRSSCLPHLQPEKSWIFVSMPIGFICVKVKYFNCIFFLILQPCHQ